MDIIGISLGANRKKWKLENSFCQLEGFFYMSTGKSYSTGLKTMGLNLNGTQLAIILND